MFFSENLNYNESPDLVPLQIEECRMSFSDVQYFHGLFNQKITVDMTWGYNNFNIDECTFYWIEEECITFDWYNAHINISNSFFGYSSESSHSIIYYYSTIDFNLTKTCFYESSLFSNLISITNHQEEECAFFHVSDISVASCDSFFQGNKYIYDLSIFYIL